MNTYNEFSQLKNFKPAPRESVAPPKPLPREERVLKDAKSSGDYFSSLLGGGNSSGNNAPPKQNRITVVTPATINRVRQEQAQDAIEAERAAAAKREEEIREELAAQTAATESLAADLANLRLETEQEVSALRKEHEESTAELSKKHEEVMAELSKKHEDEMAEACKNHEDEINLLRKKHAQELESVKQEAYSSKESCVNEMSEEIAKLKAMLAEAQEDTRLHDSLLDMPVPFSEKFRGEIREHVVESLITAAKSAEDGGRDRRARILEAVLGANPIIGELESRRNCVKRIIKEAGSRIGDHDIKELVRIGFRYVDGKNHHKIEWAGIRFPLSKTPSDLRSCENSAADINNSVF